MKYDIYRVETAKNREGNDEVFIQMSYLDEESGIVMPYARWLSQTEQEQYLHDANILENRLILEWYPFAKAMYLESKKAE